MDYADAGVNIDEEARFVEALTSGLSGIREGTGSKIEVPGGYAGVSDIGEGVLAFSVDGVGTKLLVAEGMGRFDTVGIDCVAMNVNDVVCTGIEPVAMVDYVAVERHDEDVAEELGRGLAEGCRLANVELLAGETATMPEVVDGVDLVGACVGFGGREDLARGRAEPGDSLVGLESSGIHSNGLTLAREALDRSGIELDDRLGAGTVGEALMEPTEVYVEAVLRSFREGAAKAAAHVTGGGLLNLERLGDCAYEVSNPPEPRPVFELIGEAGGVPPEEMYRTFNMGVGMVVATERPEEVVRLAEEAGHRAREIGRADGGSGVTIEGVGEL